MKNPTSEAPERIHKIVFNGIKHEEKNDYDIKEELLLKKVGQRETIQIMFIHKNIIQKMKLNIY